MREIELYPHNQETYDKIQELWKTENKVAAVQATGTGKSYLILKCIYNTPEANKVVLAPSNYILEQLVNSAGEELPNTKTITYAKLSFMSDEEIRELNISYIFLDEFHRCGAEQWGDGVQRLLNTFPGAKVLGTSATHIRFLDNVRNMGEELFNGNVVNNLSLAEAIIRKILPMPKYISALYTFEDEVNNLKAKVENSKNDDESKKELLKEIELMKHKLEKSKGIPNILKKHLSKNYNGKFIVFCKDKVHLDEMKETVVDWFTQSKVTKQVDVYSVYSDYINGDIEVNEFINNKNTKSIKLLFSIGMFNEGIHIEDVTGVILLRPTTSPIIYYQQVGRAMQVGNGNSPIIFDLVNNFSNMGARNFISDLKKHAERENDKNKDDSENNCIDVSEFMIFDEIIEATDLFSKIENNLIGDWDVMYKEIKNFYNENGHCNVNTKSGKLGNWVNTQRRYFKLLELKEERIKLLNDINFVWEVNDNKIWEDTFELLSEYYHMHNRFPEKGEVYKENILGNWVIQQRRFYKQGNLSFDKENKLNSIGFIWDMHQDRREEIANRILAFKQQYGHLNIPENYVINGNKLLLQTYVLRKGYKKGILSNEIINKLNSIGFEWDKENYKDRVIYGEYHLYNILKENNMGIVELSKLIGVQRTSVGSWVNNRFNIPKKYIPKIAEIFNIEPHLLQPQKGGGYVNKIA